ncbi:MAG TPA: hypothetical protein VK191_09005 [Symbiobacteriaceae bacterium]|nr:hypothetical protein [Symbiobacteriaceae bacterium]
MHEKKFAFLVHPRRSVQRDLGRVWRPLGWIPEAIYSLALRLLPVPPVTIGQVRVDGRTLGQIVLVPLSGRQMLSLPRPLVLRKVRAAVDHAVAAGASLVGLGALTAPVTTGGQKLADRTDVGVTNGNAFTAAITMEGLARLLAHCPNPNPTIAVVGASGSVGTCLCRLIARRLPDVSLLMVARDSARLTAAADLVRGDVPALAVTESTTMDAVQTADVVILLTSSADCLLRSEHLKEGAIVLDDTQPRNTDPTLLTERPDLMLVDGGLVQLEGISLGVNLGFPRGIVPACLAETLLLALEGHEGHFSIGAPTPEQAERIAALALKWRQYGFTLAPFYCFGRPLAPQPDLLVAEVSS